jgi:4-hydroxybenzoate polyprenyltransferase
LAGYIISNEKDIIALLLLLWCNIFGVLLVYRLNDIIDQNKDLTFNLRHFFSYPLHVVMVLQFILVTLPLVFVYINPFVFLVLAISAPVGILYSITFVWRGVPFRLKNLFLVKNFLIGIVWGALILIGAGNFDGVFVPILFTFASVQVFIGGIIRDIPDVDKDRYAGVESLPVVLGIPNTITISQTLNLGFFSYCFFTGQPSYVLIAIAIPTVWRMVNLMLLSLDPYNSRWSQSMNLFTCVLIFFSALIIAEHDILFF